MIVESIDCSLGKEMSFVYERGCAWCIAYEICSGGSLEFVQAGPFTSMHKAREIAESLKKYDAVLKGTELFVVPVVPVDRLLGEK